jgi:long-chain acyl-CoA synthetase
VRSTRRSCARFIVTSGGKTLARICREYAAWSPYIAEAVVFGHGRKYLTALIEIDNDTVSDWARSNNVLYRITSLRKRASWI